jgi:hypothetical protein
MTNDLIKIEYYYYEGMKAYNENELIRAADIFLKCYDTYENADLHHFDSRIKQIAEEALKLYTQITGLDYGFHG